MVEDELSERILKGEFSIGDKIDIDEKDGELVFQLKDKEKTSEESNSKEE